MEQLDLATFTGAHPTNREFVERLRDWGFTQRRREGVHLLMRGPHGGTVRVLRSLLGRPDPAVVAKAVRLARVDHEQFWTGPAAPESHQVLDGRAPADPADDVSTQGTPLDQDTSDDTFDDDDVSPAALSAVESRPARRSPPARDRNTSLVLAAHTSTDRPLGFDQVVRLCQGRITRAQAQAASAALCRDGHLERIRHGVYQWSGGHRAAPLPPQPAPPGPAPAPAAGVDASRWRTRPPAPPAPRSETDRPEADSPEARAGAAPTAVQLFEQLFPAGVTMTAELLADFEQWTRLTAKLAAGAGGRGD